MIPVTYITPMWSKVYTIPVTYITPMLSKVYTIPVTYITPMWSKVYTIPVTYITPMLSKVYTIPVTYSTPMWSKVYTIPVTYSTHMWSKVYTIPVTYSTPMLSKVYINSAYMAQTFQLMSIWVLSQFFLITICNSFPTVSWTCLVNHYEMREAFEYSPQEAINIFKFFKLSGMRALITAWLNLQTHRKDYIKLKIPSKLPCFFNIRAKEKK